MSDFRHAPAPPRHSRRSARIAATNSCPAAPLFGATIPLARPSMIHDHLADSFRGIAAGVDGFPPTQRCDTDCHAAVQQKHGRCGDGFEWPLRAWPKATTGRTQNIELPLIRKPPRPPTERSSVLHQADRAHVEAIPRSPSLRLFSRSFHGFDRAARAEPPGGRLLRPASDFQPFPRRVDHDAIHGVAAIRQSLRTTQSRLLPH